MIRLAVRRKTVLSTSVRLIFLSAVGLLAPQTASALDFKFQPRLNTDDVLRVYTGGFILVSWAVI